MIKVYRYGDVIPEFGKYSFDDCDWVCISDNPSFEIPVKLMEVADALSVFHTLFYQMTDGCWYALCLHN